MKEKVISTESGVSLELSPMEVEELANVLKSARMLHLGNHEFIGDLLEKLKIGGNK